MRNDFDAKAAVIAADEKTGCTLFETYLKHEKTGEKGWYLKQILVPGTGVEALKNIQKHPLFDCVVSMNDYSAYHGPGGIIGFNPALKDNQCCSDIDLVLVGGLQQNDNGDYFEVSYCNSCGMRHEDVWEHKKHTINRK